MQQSQGFDQIRHYPTRGRKRRTDERGPKGTCVRGSQSGVGDMRLHRLQASVVRSPAAVTPKLAAALCVQLSK